MAHAPPSTETWTSYEATPLVSRAAHETTNPSSPWVAAGIRMPACGADLSTRNDSDAARYSSEWPPSYPSAHIPAPRSP